MSHLIWGRSGAPCSPLQPPFPFNMYREMAQDERDLSSLQVQHSQRKRTDIKLGKQRKITEVLMFTPLGWSSCIDREHRNQRFPPNIYFKISHSNLLIELRFCVWSPSLSELLVVCIGCCIVKLLHTEFDWCFACSCSDCILCKLVEEEIV